MPRPLRTAPILALALVLLANGLHAATTNAAPAAPVPPAETPASLISNGDFSHESKQSGWPEGWGSRAEGNGITWETDTNGQHFLRLAASGADQLQVLPREIKLKPGSCPALDFTVRYRASGLKPAAAPGAAPHVVLLFFDELGRPIPAATEPLIFTDAKEWTTVQRKFAVPPSANRLEIFTGLFGAEAGTLDLGALDLRPLDDKAAAPLVAALKPTPTATPLLPNGDFSRPNADGTGPANWGLGPGMTWESANGSRYISLASQKPGQMQMLYATAPLKGVKGFNIVIRYLPHDVAIGEKPWYDARTIVNFLGADGKPVKSGSPIVFSLKAKDWTEVGHSYVVPEGAEQLQLMAGLFMSAGGTVDIARIDVTPLNAQQTALLALADTIAAGKKAEQTAEQEKKVDEKIAAQLAATGNLVTNGDFSNIPAKEPPAGLSYGTDKDIHFAHLSLSEPEKISMLYNMVLLPKGVRAIEVTYRYRTAGLKSGSKPPGDARAIFHFLSGGRTGHLEFGTTLTPDPSAIVFSSKATDWTEVTRRYLVPEGATKLQMMPGLWGNKEGTLDIAAIQVKPLTNADADAMIAEAAAVAKKQAEENAILAGELALPPIAKELHVSGNQILLPDNKPIWLQGLCLDSLEWSMGDHILWSIHVAIDEWHSNVIRLPVHQTFWFGHGKNQPPNSQDAYRKTVDDAVKLCAAKGAYLVLDLHGFGAPTAEDLAFWKDAAERYKNNPAVLFELFNEPHGISWDLWRDGGSIQADQKKNHDVNPTENNQKMTTDEAIGMQAIVDAVRATGAKNIIVSGGLDWSYDLTGILNGYALKDQGGNGIIYVAHIYPWKKGWQEKFLPVAEKYPVIVTEIGCPQKWEDFSFIPASQRYPLDGWSEDVLGMIQKYKLHWTGFSFHPHCGPMVISDWNYTPTPYWGVFVKEALAGQQFEMKKMR